MKIGNILGAIIVLLALFLAAGGVLIGSPERQPGVSERISLPLNHSSSSPIRDGADEVIFEETWENGMDRWETSDQALQLWHKSDFMTQEENDDLAWWCGDTLVGYAEEYIGYENYQIQYIQTPVLDLSQAGNNLRLTFAAKWLLEDPRRVPGGLNGMDAWDGWTVLISTNGGQSFSIIRPTSPAYTAEHISAAERFHILGGSWPGWTFESTDNGRDGWEAPEDTLVEPEWVDCVFDLTNFRRNNIVIKFEVLSDLHVAAPYNYYLKNSGVWIDDLEIKDANNRVFLSNNGTDDPEPADLIPGHGLGFTDTWELTRENVHSGNFALWNDDDNFGVTNAIDSPPFEVPADFNTHFEFWIYCDLPDSIYRAGENLCDFYQVFASDDDGETWTRVLYDYNRPEAGGDDWEHYIPGLSFIPEYVDLNLTPFAGSEIRMRWMMSCDNNHINVSGVERNGDGLFIDDIQVITSNQVPRDAGFENLSIPYPTTVRNRTRLLHSTMYNYGSRDLTQIYSFWGWDGGEYFSRSVPIIPRPSIISGDSLVINITDYADRQNPGWTPPYPGVFDVYSRSAVGLATPGDNADDDEYTANDSIGISGVRVWPAGLFELGYDNRSIRFRNEFARGSGAATRFSPADAGVNDYSLAFAHFRFNGGLDAPASFRLHVRSAGQNDNVPGADLVAFNVEVHPDSTLPGHMTVDLSGYDELKDLNGDFWLWAEITRDDFNPQILSDQQVRGAGRYFTFNGNQAQAFNGDLMMHVAVIPAANVAPNLAESEQLLDFGEVVIDDSKPREFGLYSTGINPVTITNVTASENSFAVDFPGETTLKTGEAVWFTITFTAPDDQVHAGELTIETNDGTPPNVTIIGSGTVSVKDDGIEAPLSFGLSSPFPNPFNSTTRIDYTLNQAGRVNLALYDLAGRQIRVIADQAAPSGRHTAVLQASELPAGLYIVRLQSGQNVSSQKVLLVK